MTLEDSIIICKKDAYEILDILLEEQARIDNIKVYVKELEASVARGEVVSAFRIRDKIFSTLKISDHCSGYNYEQPLWEYIEKLQHLKKLDVKKEEKSK